ncbi:type II toxin-antitoxin system Phd/YefM family antitoxin [Devosia salina]|uniref:Type II toxin-antitoxin system prevent-host-death family antitoxin n=1 Tax=Devosia salina TaxID=2860336 RepID=A0ABX8WKG8_9HYPH|nr:type II toxin-antitoxin system prevent-host-death family antitoxin [Devosia salina]QYO76790.1 type II toxin-antitoxin system prevent-host-death family antitoxin [Devosia salina]
MKVSVQTARDELSDLIDAALSGEEVIIDKADGTAVRMVPVTSPSKREFKFGLLKHLGPGPDFFEPMSEEDLAAWEGAA